MSPILTTWNKRCSWKQIPGRAIRCELPHWDLDLVIVWCASLIKHRTCSTSGFDNSIFAAKCDWPHNVDMTSRSSNHFPFAILNEKKKICKITVQLHASCEKKNPLFHHKITCSHWSCSPQLPDCYTMLELMWVNFQWSGRFLVITSWDPSVCKSNQLHVDILWFSFIKLGYIL